MIIIMDCRKLPTSPKVLVLGPVFGPRFVGPVRGPNFGLEHGPGKTLKKSLKVDNDRIFRPNWHDFCPDL